MDYLFNKYYNDIKLSDCILFRGMKNIGDNEINNNFMDIFYKMTKAYEYKIKNKEILNKIDEEFTFNIHTALNFINMYSGKNSIFLILHIKKEHNVPGIYLSDLFFNSVNNEKKIEKKIINTYENESEILLNRKFRIKILKIKNIIINKDSKYYSIKSLYKDSKKNTNNNSKKIKIVYAESCQYNLPENFIPKNNFQYFCTKL